MKINCGQCTTFGANYCSITIDVNDINYIKEIEDKDLQLIIESKSPEEILHFLTLRDIEEYIGTLGYSLTIK